MEKLEKLKNELWEKRLEKISKVKTEDWTLKQLEKVLKSLKKNKSRDPNGWINELFMPHIAGIDLKISVLKMANQIKRDQKVPTLCKVADITSIFKNKGSRADLNNDRGVFTLAVIRTIID